MTGKLAQVASLLAAALLSATMALAAAPSAKAQITPGGGGGVDPNLVVEIINRLGTIANATTAQANLTQLAGQSLQWMAVEGRVSNCLEANRQRLTIFAIFGGEGGKEMRRVGELAWTALNCEEFLVAVGMEIAEKNNGEWTAEDLAR